MGGDSCQKMKTLVFETDPTVNLFFKEITVRESIGYIHKTEYVYTSKKYRNRLKRRGNPGPKHLKLTMHCLYQLPSHYHCDNSLFMSIVLVNITLVYALSIAGNSGGMLIGWLARARLRLGI